MIHYHVWFDLRPGTAEEHGLRVVRRFLDQLCEATEATGFQLLRNKGSAPRSKLAMYHALIEFTSADQLSAAMRSQVARGVHTGLHGDVVQVVTNFHVEVFDRIEDVATAAVGQYACEI